MTGASGRAGARRAPGRRLARRAGARRFAWPGAARPGRAGLASAALRFSKRIGARLWGAVLASAALGCGGASAAGGPGAWAAPVDGGLAAPARPVRGADEWREARRRWEALGAELAPSHARSVPIATTLRAPFLGAPVRARGAYAVRAPDGLRLQLVGPTGTLVLDVWAGAGDWRMASLGRVERKRAGDERPGHPAAFLRWWLVRPLEGRLLYAGRFEGGDWLFGARSAGGASLRVRASADGRALDVERRSAGVLERVRAEGLPCGLARYEYPARGVSVEVRCEGEPSEPSPRAFDDPDRAGAR